MLKLKSFGHINIVVDDIDRATDFYQKSLGAVPVHEAPHFKNAGFARAAGFLSDPERVDVSIRFLAIPMPTPLLVELMRYHSPRGNTRIPAFKTHDAGGPRHICLRVENIEQAFAHLAACRGVRMINPSRGYRPYQLEPITPEQFKVFDSRTEANRQAKEQVAQRISAITFFYFLDPYGVQWEIEQAPD